MAEWTQQGSGANKRNKKKKKDLTTSFHWYDEMIPSKPNGHESRRSSILKPCKPRQPLQNVNFNSPCTENSPSTSKIKRRVSFAEKKHVKEFCHSTDQGTVWDNTYEEHDFSLKGSLITDQNRENESKKSMTECTSKNGCTHVTVDTSNYTNDSNVASNPKEIFENHNDNDCNLNFTNSVKYIELSDEGSLVEQSMLLNVSRNIPSNIVVYRDEKNCESNVGDNITSKLDKTSNQDLFMEFTGVISTFSSSSHFDTKGNKTKDTQEDDAVCQNNLYVDCNMSMEITRIVPTSIEPIEPHLGMSNQISVIQNCENAKYDDTNDTCNNAAMFPINSQLPQSIVYEQTQDGNSGDDSMELTTVVNSLVTSIDIHSMNNNENDTVSNSSMKVAAILPETRQGNITFCDGNTVTENRLRKDRETSENTDKTEFFNNETMEITRPVNIALLANIYKQEDPRVNKPVLTQHRTTFFHDVSMEMTTAMSLKDGQEITDSSICKLSLKENKEGKKNINKSICSNERTELFRKSMELTQAVSVPLYHERTCDATHNIESAEASLSQMSRMHLPEENFTGSILQSDRVINDNETIHSISMEITGTVSSENRQEIVNPNIHKLLLVGNTEKEKRVNRSISSNERTELLHKSMDFTEAVPSYQDDVLNMHTTQSREILLSQTTPRQQLPSKNSTGSVLQMDAITNDNKTIHDISMEMTGAVSLENRQEIVNPNIHKLLLVENTEKEKRINRSISSNERTELLHKSMDFTEAVPSYQEAILNTTCTAQSTEMLLSQTTPRQQLPSKNSTGSVLQTDAITNDNKTIHDISMEMTGAVSSENRQEIVNPNIHKSLVVENTEKEKRISRSISFNERTELLHKSMDFTEAVPSYQDGVLNMHTTQSREILLSQTTPRQQLPSKNSTESLLQTDAITNDNKIIHNESMEITTAVPSNLHLTQNTVVNETKKLIVSKSNKSTTIDTRESEHLIEFGKNVRIENVQFSKKTMETTNMHDELVNNHVTLTDNLDFSCSATLGNVTSRKRVSCENENTDPKRVRNSLESQYCKENDVHSSHKVNDNYVNDDSACDERLAEDTINFTHTLAQTSENDSLDEINECNFFRKSLPYLENNFLELQSINPPSFVYMNSEEENSDFDTPREDGYKTSMITDAASSNDKNSSSDRLELTNIKYNQAEDYHKNIVTSKIENDLEANCQAMVGSINSNNQINKSNYYGIDTEVPNGENILSISNANYGKIVTAPSIGTRLIDEDQVDEKENTREEINDDAKLPSIEKQERYSDTQEELETEKRQIVECVGRLKESEAIIENQKDREEHRGENLSIEANVQSMMQEEECANVKDRLEAEQCVSVIEDEPVVEQDPFLSLLRGLETYAESDDCIWNVHHKNIDKKIIVFGFISSSLLIVMFLSDNINHLGENLIKQIKIISRLSDDADVLIKIVHELITEKINAEVLMHLYKTHEDLLPMLNFISQDVKLAMDFMFDLKRLDDLNLMEIARDNISFVSRSKQLDIILKVTVNVKRFDKLTPNDISIQCLLGTIKKIEAKNLIKGVKKDHKFLRRYMKDVRDYIDIMEEISTQSNNRK